jgi:hypothetical protein
MAEPRETRASRKQKIRAALASSVWDDWIVLRMEPCFICLKRVIHARLFDCAHFFAGQKLLDVVVKRTSYRLRTERDDIQA